MKTILLRSLAVLLFASVVPLTFRSAAAETWTTLQGQQFEAEFRGMWGNAAIFQRADGRRAAIAPLNMQAESRLRLKAMVKEIEEKRRQRVEQLQQETLASQNSDQGGAGMLGGAMEKHPLPPVVAYAPMPDSLDLKASIKHLQDQMFSGHVRALWDAMPTSYQADWEKLRVELTDEIPAAQWDSRLDLLAKVARILKDKQDMIFGAAAAAPLLQRMDDKSQSELRTGLSTFGEQLTTLLSEKRFTHENLSKQELGQLIAELSDRYSQSLRQMLESSPTDSAPPFDSLEFNMQSDDRGTILNPANGEETVWVRVQGRWLPEEPTKDWPGMMAKVKKGLSAAMGPESNAQVAQINQVLDGLLDANDQQAFDAVVLSVISKISSAVMPTTVPN